MSDAAWAAIATIAGIVGGVVTLLVKGLIDKARNGKHHHREPTAGELDRAFWIQAFDQIVERRVNEGVRELKDWFERK